MCFKVFFSMLRAQLSKMQEHSSRKRDVEGETKVTDAIKEKYRNEGAKEYAIGLAKMINNKYSLGLEVNEKIEEIDMQTMVAIIDLKLDQQHKSEYTVSKPKHFDISFREPQEVFTGLQTTNISTVKPVLNVEQEAQSVVSGIFIGNKPVTPEEDVNGKYIWKLVNPHCPEFSQLEIDGYVFASNSYAQYIYLRKAREEVSYRFKTVDRVHIGNSVIYLGDCRTTSCSITRDVINIVPPKDFKLHTLTCIISSNGTETYICEDAKYPVWYGQSNTATA